MIIINLCLQHLSKPYIYLLYFSCFFPTYLTFNVNCLLFFVRVTFQYLIYYRKKRNMKYKCNKENKIIYKIHHRLKRNRFTKKNHLRSQMLPFASLCLPDNIIPIPEAGIKNLQFSFNKYFVCFLAHFSTTIYVFNKA